MQRGLYRGPLLAIALLSMLGSSWLGLARIGWPLPLPSPDHVLLHGPLFVGGFFGTLITLERAVSLGAGWAYAAPTLSASGAILLAVGRTESAAAAITAASALLLASALVVVRRRGVTLPTIMGVAGAAAWLAGNAQWLAGAAVYQVVYWWAGFLVIAVAGTRIGRNQAATFTPLTAAWFSAAILLLAVGIIFSSRAPSAGVPLAGAGLLLIAAWLARHDAAARTAPRHGRDGYMAIATLAGYAWLAAGGAIALAYGGVTVGPRYDAVLHSVLLGFVISVVFGHAPLVFPAILGIALPHRPAFYAHLALLHVSLALRVGADIIAGHGTMRAWGGLLNAAAILLFVANVVRSALLARRDA